MSTNTLTYGVAYTSENVAAACEMMSLIWTDEFIASTLIYGLEGESFVWNEDKSSIVYPEGLDINTVPYKMCIRDRNRSAESSSGPRPGPCPGW